MARQREQITFFVCRSLGGKSLVTTLRELGETVVGHDEAFAADCEDVAWLPVVGQRGFAVLSKDQGIARNELELAALRTFKVAAFFLSARKLTGPEQVRAFVAALPRIKTLMDQLDRPIVARVAPSGAVTVIVGNRRGGRRDPSM